MQGFLDADQLGTSLNGLIRRVGFAASGVFYLGLAAATVQMTQAGLSVRFPSSARKSKSPSCEHCGTGCIGIDAVVRQFVAAVMPQHHPQPFGDGTAPFGLFECVSLIPNRKEPGSKCVASQTFAKLEI